MPPKDKYTDPKLRDEVKEEIHQSDKGGAPGQWSARKAQMMAAEYKKRGGEYNTDKSEKDESQKNLDRWGEEDWQTKEGSGNAKKEDGTEKRYLPKEAWEKMNEKEKEETDEKKQKESKEGKQFVANTEKAKNKRQEVSEQSNGKQSRSDRNEDDDDESNDDDDDQDEDDGGIYGTAEDEDDDDEYDDADEDEGEDGEEGNEESEGEAKDKRDESKEAGQKRKGPQMSNERTKKQKQSNSKSSDNASKGTVGSKHMPDEEQEPRGSADRLPKKGQHITWKAMPGYVDGKVTEVLTQGKTIDGKSVKASKDDPKIVMESDSSGKICVHKPEACFYE